MTRCRSGSPGRPPRAGGRRPGAPRPGRAGRRADGRREPLAEPVLGVHRAEQVPVGGDRLGRPEEQVPARPQGVVEQGDQLLLQVRPEVDEQVPARDQVEPGERRVADQVVAREQAQLPDLLDHVVLAALLEEEPLEPLGRHVLGDRQRVGPLAGDGQGPLVDVGGEDLDLGRVRDPVEPLADEHGQGVRLLPGGAPGHPDADRVGRRAVGEELREDLPGQGVERLRVAEELGHPDQQVLEQRGGLVLVGLRAARRTGRPSAGGGSASAGRRGGPGCWSCSA